MTDLLRLLIKNTLPEEKIVFVSIYEKSEFGSNLNFIQIVFVVK